MFVFVCSEWRIMFSLFSLKKTTMYTEEVYRELQQQQNKKDTVKSLTNQIVDNIFHFMLQFNLKFKCVKYKSRKLVSSANYSPTLPFLYILSFGLATILLYCFPRYFVVFWCCQNYSWKFTSPIPVCTQRRRKKDKRLRHIWASIFFKYRKFYLLAT